MCNWCHENKPNPLDLYVIIQHFVDGDNHSRLTDLFRYFESPPKGSFEPDPSKAYEYGPEYTWLRWHAHCAVEVWQYVLANRKTTGHHATTDAPLPL